MRWWCIHPGPAGMAHGCGATAGDGTSPPLSLLSSSSVSPSSSGVALGALGLLEERGGGAGGADVALATLRAELTHCEWEISESKVGIGQAEETVALATMRGELRSTEAQLTATASLLSWARAARFTKSELRKGAAQEISLTDL